MARQKKDTMDAVLQATLLNQAAGGQNEETTALLAALVKKHLEELKEEEAKDKVHQEEQIRWTREMMEAKKAKRENCAHKKPHGETALQGQYLPNGQLCLICSVCSSDFHKPAQKDQYEPPAHLIPQTNVGGSIEIR